MRNYISVWFAEHGWTKDVLPQHSMKTRTIHIPKGLTIEEALSECKELFPIWRWTDENLDKLVTSDRTSKKAYSIKVSDTVEADEDLKDMSAEDLKEKDIPCITLLERIVMELDYFKETGKHLDIENITLCAGSRYRDGLVPCAFWGGVKFDVSWYDSGCRGSSVRARRVAVPSTLTSLSLEARVEKLEEFEEKVRKFLIL